MKTMARHLICISALFCLIAVNHANAQEVNHQEMDHSKMDHSSMKTESAETNGEEMDHSKMDHSTMDHSEVKQSAKEEGEQKVDHSKMGHSMMDHSMMDHSQMNKGESSGSIEPLTPIPVITDADRLAAFPEVHAHSMHDESALHSLVIIDQLEIWNATSGVGLGWDAVAWFGSDVNRLWLRTEGEYVDSSLESAELEALGGHSIAPWWDLVAGIRHDFKPGHSQDFFALGIMGLSPYKFETDITLYVGENGQTAARLLFEYETLFTNRLILQPKLELNFYGKDDPERGIGSGLSNLGLGLRLRYEFTRQFAPYLGLSWHQSYGQTADYLREQGESTDSLELLAGLRIWF
ncbi:MAG TPA: copper resistance protein B [Arenimonas sp.]|nr:copper resistance protein B [Arenimonas sp.]